MKRREFARSVVTAPIALTAAPAFAQDGARPLRLLVGFAAGGVTDTVARVAAEEMRGILGRQVIVENRPGAGGRIAASDLRRAAPDGNTLMITTETIAVLAAFVFRNLDFDVRRDFIPVSQLATFQLAFTVPASLPATTFEEYVRWARANPGRASFGALQGSQSHFWSVLIGRAIGVEFNFIAYNSAAPMTTDVTGGHVSAVMDAISQNIQAHRAGQLRTLATSGARRSPMAPEIPTFRELGYELEGTGYLAAFAPAGTPAATVATLSSAFARALAVPAARERLAAFGLEPTGTSSQELQDIMDAGFRRWGPIIQSLGFVAD